MHTSSGVDNVDDFAETVEHRGKISCYRYGAECRPLTVRKVTVRYRGADGRLAARTFTTYRTHHGPVVRSANGRWIAFAMMNRPVEAIQQSFLRTKAHDFASFLEVAQLKAKHLKPIPLSGQDATVEGAQYIISGWQTGTVYKSVRKEANAAAAAAIAIIKHKPVKGVNGKTSGTKSILLTPVWITKKNYTLLFKEGFLKKSQVCVGEYKKYCK
jgi:hypothetical protein